jgi:hypothetical protein
MPFASTPTTHDRPAYYLGSKLLLAFTGLWCFYWFIHAWGYWEDDAYIHLEFARSLVIGQGFAFNGHVVAGDTAPLWVFLLAGMHTVIPNWLIAGKVLTLLGAIFGIAGIFTFARKLAASLLPNTTLFPAAMVVLIVVNPYSTVWLFSGMESFAAAGLACFVVVAATREAPTTRSFLAACLIAGIGPLLRPELILLAALLSIPLLGQWRKLSAKAATFAGGLLLFCGPVAAWSLYSLHAFGHLLPNTNAAKRAGVHDSIVRHLLSSYSLGFPLILCGLLAGILFVILRPAAVRNSIRHTLTATFTSSAEPAPVIPIACWIFLLWPLIAAIFYIINHTYVQTRYILVSAPGLTIVLMALFLAASRRTGRVVYIASLAVALAVSLLVARPFIRNKALNCRAVDGYALFIRNQIPSDAPVAAYAIGQIAFVSQHPIVDTGGITRPGAIPYFNAPEIAMVRWAKSQGAQYYFADYRPEPGATLVYAAATPFVGWTFRTGLYKTTGIIRLWKLAPSSEPQLPKSSPANSIATSNLNARTSNP